MCCFYNMNPPCYVDFISIFTTWTTLFYIRNVELLLLFIFLQHEPAPRHVDRRVQNRPNCLGNGFQRQERFHVNGQFWVKETKYFAGVGRYIGWLRFSPQRLLSFFLSPFFKKISIPKQNVAECSSNEEMVILSCLSQQHPTTSLLPTAPSPWGSPAPGDDVKCGAERRWDKAKGLEKHGSASFRFASFVIGPGPRFDNRMEFSDYATRRCRPALCARFPTADNAAVGEDVAGDVVVGTTTTTTTTTNSITSSSSSTITIVALPP